MNRNWDNRISQPRYEAAVAEEPEPVVWDFARSSEADNFKFTRRSQKRSYRVVGDYADYTLPALPAPMANPGRASSRPNRYNASVKVVAGDLGPAPWEDWEPVSYLKLPIMGEVAAGRYDVTVAYHETGQDADADFVLVNSEEIKVSRDTYALRVRGQSMIDNEIDHGDIIIVQAQDWADDGDFVIACLADSTDSAGFVTLKRFYRHRQADRVILQPANQTLSPIHILPHKGDASRDDLDGVKIQGRVTAIIKTGNLY